MDNIGMIVNKKKLTKCILHRMYKDCF